MMFDQVLVMDWCWNFVVFFMMFVRMMLIRMMFFLMVGDWNLVNNVWLNMSDFMVNDMWTNWSMVLFTLMMLWDRPENKWLINNLVWGLMNIMMQDRRL